MKNPNPHRDEIGEFVRKHGISRSTAKHVMRIGFNHDVTELKIGGSLHFIKQWLDENDYTENVDYFYLTTGRFFFKDPELATMVKLSIHA